MHLLVPNLRPRFEVDTVLKYLQIGKANEPDAINNRILKELAQLLP